MKQRTFTTLLILSLAVPGIAQTAKVVPSISTNPGNGSSVTPHPFYWTDKGSRFQQILSASSLATGIVRIREIAFRRGQLFPLPFPAFTSPNLVIKFGVAATTPNTMSRTFANNRAGAMTTFFSGTVSAPASAPGNNNFVIKIPLTTPYVHTVATGDILMEVEVDASSQPQSQWLVESFAPFTMGSDVAPIGTGGQFASGQNLTTFGGFIEPVMPGGALTLTAPSLNAQFPGIAAYGATKLGTPMDLGPAGAPGNSIYIGVDLLLPVTYTKELSGLWRASSRVALPPLASLAGLKVFGQMAFTEPASSALGLVTGPAWEFTIGTLPMLESQSIFAPTNTLLEGDYIQRSNLSIGAAPVIELTGDFL